jgi:hypothetical protein
MSYTYPLEPCTGSPRIVTQHKDEFSVFGLVVKAPADCGTHFAEHLAKIFTSRPVLGVHPDSSLFWEML